MSAVGNLLVALAQTTHAECALGQSGVEHRQVAPPCGELLLPLSSHHLII